VNAAGDVAGHISTGAAAGWYRRSDGTVHAIGDVETTLTVLGDRGYAAGTSSGGPFVHASAVLYHPRLSGTPLAATGIELLELLGVPAWESRPADIGSATGDGEDRFTILGSMAPRDRHPAEIDVLLAWDVVWPEDVAVIDASHVTMREIPVPRLALLSPVRHWPAAMNDRGEILVTVHDDRGDRRTGLVLRGATAIDVRSLVPAARRAELFGAGAGFGDLSDGGEILFSTGTDRAVLLTAGCLSGPRTEVCDNGLDDDGDGLTDCADAAECDAASCHPCDVSCRACEACYVAAGTTPDWCSFTPEDACGTAEDCTTCRDRCGAPDPCDESSPEHVAFPRVCAGWCSQLGCE
jgi:hypothetical protein